MLSRNSLNLTQIADVHNIALAFTRAAKGKRGRPEVTQFEANLWDELHQVQGYVYPGCSSQAQEPRGRGELEQRCAGRACRQPQRPRPGERELEYRAPSFSSALQM